MKTGSLIIQRALGILFVLAILLAVIPVAISAEPPQQGPIVYYVRYGDTLFSIAMRFGTNVPAIMQANGLMSDYIYAGQRLIIPLYPITPGPTATLYPTPSNFDCTYTVQYRDTVYSIGYRYGVPWYVLMQANYMYTPYLRVGQVLRVPCLSPTPTPFPMHVVQSGENLFRIAIQFNTTIYAIALTNGICNPNWVYAGQNLIIPYPGSYVWPPVPTITPTNTPGPSPTPNPLTPTATATAGPSPTPTATTIGAATAFITMFNIQFVPQSLTVPRGTIVRWTNSDSVSHSVRSGVPGAPASLFNSGTIASGGAFQFTFNDAGTFSFFSELDQNMTGSVTVQ
jgi:LysM repeat protein